jgi:hypothetical protein
MAVARATLPTLVGWIIDQGIIRAGIPSYVRPLGTDTCVARGAGRAAKGGEEKAALEEEEEEEARLNILCLYLCLCLCLWYLNQGACRAAAPRCTVRRGTTGCSR